MYLIWDFIPFGSSGQTAPLASNPSEKCTWQQRYITGVAESQFNYYLVSLVSKMRFSF